MDTRRVAESPRISRRLLGWFRVYTDWYLWRHFHAIRLSRESAQLPANAPLIVCLNHPGWWDPLLCLYLSARALPGHDHFGPIESKAVAQYQFFERLGFFGIEPGTSRGAARFLKAGADILSRPRSALWVTAQGEFTDPRRRPAQLRAGIGHLVRRLENVAVVPLALEYPFWDERFPEALARFGEPVWIERGRDRSAEEWTAEFERALERTQDALAAEAAERRPEAFEVLLGGRSGVGGIYDLWRAFLARVRGQVFRGSHSGEVFR